MTFAFCTPPGKIDTDLFDPSHPGEPVNMPVLDLVLPQMPPQPADKPSPGAAGIDVVARREPLQTKASDMECSRDVEVEKKVIDSRRLLFCKEENPLL